MLVKVSKVQCNPPVTSLDVRTLHGGAVARYGRELMGSVETVESPGAVQRGSE